MLQRLAAMLETTAETVLHPLCRRALRSRRGNAIIYFGASVSTLAQSNFCRHGWVSLRRVVEAMGARSAHRHPPPHCVQWPCQQLKSSAVLMQFLKLPVNDIFSGDGKRARALRRVKRHHPAYCGKVTPGQPPFDPAAVFNLLAITCWATFVLWPLATWALDLA